MPERYLAQTVAALGKARKPVLVWLQFQDCTGCSESMLRSSHPEVADVVLDLLSWEYHEVIMAGAADAANKALERVVKEEKGKYLVVVEGAIPMADGGVYCTIGGRTAIDIAREVCGSAAATIAVGACAFDGGLVRSVPVGRAAELGATRIFVLHVGRLEQPLRLPTRPWQVALVAFEIARRHQFEEEFASLPQDVEVHVLPSGSTTPALTVRYRSTSGVQGRIDAAYDAASVFLDAVNPR